jgi:hypothetical protein
MRVRIEFELSPRVKRALRIAAPIAVVLLGGVALAGVPHTFNNGDPLSAQAMNDNFANLDSRLAKVESLSVDGGIVLGQLTIWKDSNGALVPVVRHVGGFGGGNQPFTAIYEVIDPPSTAVWTYNPGGAPEMTAGGAYEGFLQANCTGTPSVYYPPPARYAFKIATDPNNYYMIPDKAVETISAALSWQAVGSGCQNNAIGGIAVLVSALVQVAKPNNPPGTPPYHPETL